MLQGEYGEYSEHQLSNERASAFIKSEVNYDGEDGEEEEKEVSTQQTNIGLDSEFCIDAIKCEFVSAKFSRN